MMNWSIYGCNIFQTIFFLYSYKFKMVRMLQYCTLKTPAFLCFMGKKIPLFRVSLYLGDFVLFFFPHKDFQECKRVLVERGDVS